MFGSSTLIFFQVSKLRSQKKTRIEKTRRLEVFGSVWSSKNKKANVVDPRFYGIGIGDRTILLVLSE